MGSSRISRKPIPSQIVDPIGSPVVSEYLALDDREKSSFLNLTGHFNIKEKAASHESARIIQHESLPQEDGHPQWLVPSRRSWRAPIIMIGTLILGLALALAHHGMNLSLNGKVVPSSGSITQQWIVRYATALAFFVKMLFVICIGTSFVQRQWLHISTFRQPLRVQDLDVLSSALGDITSFSKKIWLKHSLLFVVAVISWTVPFAAIIAPASLSVQLSANIFQANASNPLPSFSYMDYCANTGWEVPIPPPANFTFDLRESLDLSKIAFGTATSSKVLSASPKFPFMKYSLDFFGPALKCQAADDGINKAANAAGQSGSLQYFAWTGSPPWTEDKLLNESYIWHSLDPGDMLYNMNETDGNSLYIWTILRPYYTPLRQVTECRLWNASYHVDVDVQNFTQSTKTKVTYLHPSWATMSTIMDLFFDESISSIDLFSSILSYKCMMSAVGTLLVGTDPPNNKKVSHYELLNIDLDGPDPLWPVVEEYFQNMTLSLFSNPYFLSKQSNLVNQTITNFSNTYVYEERDLLLAYGITFLVSLVCCIIGLHSCYVSKLSYRNNFSTYLRAIQNSSLSGRLIGTSDVGADPLPKEIGRMVFKLDDSGSER